MKVGSVIVLLLVVVFVCCVAVLCFVGVSYNNLIKCRNKVKNSWAHIDAQLQRRFDLVPNLVETIKGFVAHEQSLIHTIEESRNRFFAAHNSQEKIQTNAELNSSLRLIQSISQQYPQLKSDKHFLQLQNDLAEIEEDISYARQFYNDAVTIYNNKRMMFPNNLVAAMFHFEEERLFDAVKEAEIAPKIRFKKHQYTKCPICSATVSGEEDVCPYCNTSLSSI